MPEVLHASKFGKTNLNFLKNRLQHKKEVTQTVVQTGGAGPHLQATINYANAEIPYQGVPDSTTKPTVADLASLRNKLEKTKEERETTKLDDAKATLASLRNKIEKSKEEREKILAGSVNNTINNPPNRRLMAGPRTVTPANHASNDTCYVLSASSPQVTCQLWQCAHCQTVNEAHHTACEHCKLPLGRMADRSSFCNFCQMMIFIPLGRADSKDKYCPRCKHIYESAL